MKFSAFLGATLLSICVVTSPSVQAKDYRNTLFFAVYPSGYVQISLPDLLAQTGLHANLTIYSSMGVYLSNPPINQVIFLESDFFPLIATISKIRLETTDESGDRTTYRCRFIESVDYGGFRCPLVPVIPAKK